MTWADLRDMRYTYILYILLLISIAESFKAIAQSNTVWRAFWLFMCGHLILGGNLTLRDLGLTFSHVWKDVWTGDKNGHHYGFPRSEGKNTAGCLNTLLPLTRLLDHLATRGKPHSKERKKSWRNCFRHFLGQVQWQVTRGHQRQILPISAFFYKLAHNSETRRVAAPRKKRIW